MSPDNVLTISIVLKATFVGQPLQNAGGCAQIVCPLSRLHGRKSPMCLATHW